MEPNIIDVASTVNFTKAVIGSKRSQRVVMTTFGTSLKNLAKLKFSGIPG